MISLLLYNLGMTAVDVAAWVALRRAKRLSNHAVAVVAAAVAAVVLAVVLAFNPFVMMRLLCYGLFLHGTVVLAVLAVVLWAERRLLALAASAAALLLVVVAVDAFVVEPSWLEITHYRIKSAKLDRPVRVVVLADLQTDHIGAYERRALEQALAEKPNVILLAGDYLQVSGRRFPPLCTALNKLLRELNFAAPDGVFAVGGNVDSPGWREIFAGLPVTAVDGVQTFDTAGLSLTCLPLGVSGQSRLTLSRPADDRFHVILGHRPDYALGDADADLLLAGHTHGGQVRLPGVGPLLTMAAVPREWAAGLTELSGGRKLLVSRGIGMERGGAPRLRFLCRPELVVVDLVPATAGQ